MMNRKWKGGANRAVGKGSLAVLVLLVGASVSFAHAARDTVHIETCLVAALSAAHPEVAAPHSYLAKFGNHLAITKAAAETYRTHS